MAELKPCPFCGGEATLTKEYGRFFVSCENDNCSVGVETTLWVSGTMDGAIKAWNRRAEDGDQT